MNINEIRKMTDQQLIKYINRLSSRKTVLCGMCGTPIASNERRAISVGIYNKSVGQKTKQLCNLCNECYATLLDFLSVSDVLDDFT